MKWPPATFSAFQKIKACCEKEALLVPGGLVLAGVSGGLDSIFLLHFLEDYRKEVPFLLRVAHLNHMIRGREADQDQELVRDFCLLHDLPFFPVTIDVPRYARDRKMGLEEAGREVRQQAFMEIGERESKKAGLGGDYRIALAHHMDDRAETILMNMGRGTGLQGLSGIRYREGPFIRPMLDLRRAEVLEAAEAAGMAWREDASNLSDDFLRNRIRNRLIPTWEESLGYDPVPLLVRLGKLAQRDGEALDRLAEKLYQEASLADGSLSLADLAKAPPALASRVLQCYYRDRQGEGRALTASQIEALLDLIEGLEAGDRKEARLSLPGGHRARLAYGRLYIED